MRLARLPFVLFLATCSAALAEPASRTVEKNPATKPLSPCESMKRLKIAPGFRMELVASEPQIREPVALSWDGTGVCSLSRCAATCRISMQPAPRSQLAGSGSSRIPMGTARWTSTPSILTGWSNRVPSWPSMMVSSWGSHRISGISGTPTATGRRTRRSWSSTSFRSATATWSTRPIACCGGSTTGFMFPSTADAIRSATESFATNAFPPSANGVWRATTRGGSSFPPTEIRRLGSSCRRAISGAKRTRTLVVP
jgi:hypothetical protein